MNNKTDNCAAKMANLIEYNKTKCYSNKGKT